MSIGLPGTQRLGPRHKTSFGGRSIAAVSSRRVTRGIHNLCNKGAPGERSPRAIDSRHFATTRASRETRVVDKYVDGSDGSDDVRDAALAGVEIGDI